MDIYPIIIIVIDLKQMPFFILDDGRYALIEFKLGSDEIDLGATHLCEIERLIGEYNKRGNTCPLRMPDLKLVITGTKYGYRRDDGVFVIPIGCLRD